MKRKGLLLSFVALVMLFSLSTTTFAVNHTNHASATSEAVGLLYLSKHTLGKVAVIDFLTQAKKKVQYFRARDLANRNNIIREINAAIQVVRNANQMCWSPNNVTYVGHLNRAIDMLQSTFDYTVYLVD